MKRLLLGACCAALLIWWAGAARAEEGVYLRVLARDDSLEAQAEKLAVRSQVLAALPQEPLGAWALLPVMEDAAQTVSDCTARVALWTPSPGIPAAPAIVVTIGPGRGHNWWGVLFRDARYWARADADDENDTPEADGVAEETDEDGGEGLVFVWPLWVWLCRLFSGG